VLRSALRDRTGHDTRVGAPAPRDHSTDGWRWSYIGLKRSYQGITHWALTRAGRCRRARGTALACSGLPLSAAWIFAIASAYAALFTLVSSASCARCRIVLSFQPVVITAIVAVFIGSGITAAELRGLKTDDHDVGRSRVSVYVKKRRQRIARRVSVAAFAVDLLPLYRDSRGEHVMPYPQAVCRDGKWQTHESGQTKGIRAKRPASRESISVRAPGPKRRGRANTMLRAVLP